MKRMYIPALFAETRVDVLHEFIRTHPLGTLIANGPEGPEAAHLPFFLDASAGKLRCHMARANPLCRLLQSPGRALVTFVGADHYITPSWYASKREDARVVPTWNYTAVHAAGPARLFDGADSLIKHLHELTDSQESGLPHPWSVSDAPPKYVEGLAKAIVGVEISIDRLEGKWKVSQNRSDADRQGVIAGLEALGSNSSHEMAKLIRDHNSRIR